MHIAYSAARQSSKINKPDVSKPSVEPAAQTRLRYKGYKAACHKYQHEIEAIRQYMPGWKPKFS